MKLGPHKVLFNTGKLRQSRSGKQPQQQNFRNLGLEVQLSVVRKYEISFSMPDGNMATYIPPPMLSPRKKCLVRNPSAIGDRRELEGERERGRRRMEEREGGGFRCLRALRIQAKRSCRVLVMADGQGEREREGPPLPVIFLDSAPICPSLALTGPRLSS